MARGPRQTPPNHLSHPLTTELSPLPAPLTPYYSPAQLSIATTLATPHPPTPPQPRWQVQKDNQAALLARLDQLSRPRTRSPTHSRIHRTNKLAAETAANGNAANASETRGPAINGINGTGTNGGMAGGHGAVAVGHAGNSESYRSGPCNGGCCTRQTSATAGGSAGEEELAPRSVEKQKTHPREFSRDLAA